MCTRKKCLCFLANCYSANAVKHVKHKPIRVSLEAASVMPRLNLPPVNHGSYLSGNPKVKCGSQVHERKAASSSTEFWADASGR